MERVSAKEKVAFDILLEMYMPVVFRFCYGLLKDATMAEDITQEVFVKLWKNLKKYKSEKNFKAWLFAIARNTAIDRLRKRKNINFSEFEDQDGENSLLDSIADTAPWPDELVAKAENLRVVEELINKLPAIYREVIILRYKDQFTFEEIGKIIKRPENTVKSQHKRALAIFKKLLDATN